MILENLQLWPKTVKYLREKVSYLKIIVTFDIVLSLIIKLYSLHIFRFLQFYKSLMIKAFNTLLNGCIVFHLFKLFCLESARTIT